MNIYEYVMSKKKIGIACDHAGYQMKEFMVGYLDSLGFDVYDFGCNNEQSCDYPDYAHPLALALEAGEFSRAIALCGSGNGIAITLNKHQKVRAAICWDVELAELARLHNDANVCVLPARFIENAVACSVVDKFLGTEFEGGRHQLRVDKIPVTSF